MKRVLRMAAFVAITALAVPATYADDLSALAGHPLSAAELTALYSGKTWQWSSGGGYFRPDHTFLAWSGTGTDRAIGAGQWQAGKLGRICFAAKWYVGNVEHPARSCFLTVQTGKKITQRNVDDGNRWYIFKHPEIQPYDEINKLVDGDKVTTTFTKLERKRIFK